MATSADRARYEQEVADLIEIMRNDPVFTEDNPDLSDAQYRECAIADIVNLGTDSGGYLANSELPYTNPQAVKDFRRCQREWRAIHRLATAEQDAVQV